MIKKTNPDFSQFEEISGITFRNKELLRRAFTHRSYLNENRNLESSHNERLEFLGDAVIELIVTAHLYKEFPEKAEGELTNWRAALVNAKMMTSVSEELGFNSFLLLSRGETKETGKARAINYWSIIQVKSFRWLINRPERYKTLKCSLGSFHAAVIPL